MAIKPTVSSQGPAREKLPAGQHPVVLGLLKPDTKTFQDKVRDVFVWRWDSLTQNDENGQPLCIWCDTNQNYGFHKASITKLLNQIFGPELTEEDVAQLDLELLVGRIKGYVIVLDDVNSKGEPIVRFGGFVHNKKAPYPTPSDFFEGSGDPAFATADRSVATADRSVATADRSVATAEAPAPPARTSNHIAGVGNRGRGQQVAPSLQGRPQPEADSFDDDLEDPFAE